MKIFVILIEFSDPKTRHITWANRLARYNQAQFGTQNPQKPNAAHTCCCFWSRPHNEEKEEERKLRADSTMVVLRVIYLAHTLSFTKDTLTYFGSLASCICSLISFKYYNLCPLEAINEKSVIFIFLVFLVF